MIHTLLNAIDALSDAATAVVIISTVCKLLWQRITPKDTQDEE